MIDRAVVAKMAELSRLELTEDEMARFGTQMGAILNYVASLPPADVSEHHEPADLRLEADEPRASPGTNLLRNAVAMERGLVKVPAILNKDSENDG